MALAMGLEASKADLQEAYSSMRHQARVRERGLSHGDRTITVCPISFIARTNTCCHLQAKREG